MPAAACTLRTFDVRGSRCFNAFSLNAPRLNTLSLNTLSLNAPCLPAVARRTRRQRRIKTRMGGVCRLHLVGVGLGNAERFKSLHHARMQPLRPRRVARLPGGNGVNMGHLLGQGSGAFRLRQQGCQHLLCARG